MKAKVFYDEEVIQKNYTKEVISEAVDEVKAHGAQGIVELGEELHWSDEKISSYLQQKLEISKEEANKYLELFGK